MCTRRRWALVTRWTVSLRYRHISLSMVSLNIVVLLSDVSRRLKTGWQEHTSKLFSCSLYVRHLFECDGRSKALGTGRLLLARKTARDSLISAWLYGLLYCRMSVEPAS